MTFIQVRDLRPWVAAGVIDPEHGGPGGWVQAAVCAQTDPDAFYPEGGRPAKSAKGICKRCDVRNECLTYALVTGEEHGVWGGASANERQRMEVPEPPDTGKRPLRAAPAPAGSFYHLLARRQTTAVRMMAGGVPADVVAAEVQLAADTVRRLWREHQAVNGSQRLNEPNAPAAEPRGVVDQQRRLAAA